jgi:hypothetical protein
MGGEKQGLPQEVIAMDSERSWLPRRCNLSSVPEDKATMLAFLSIVSATV